MLEHHALAPVDIGPFRFYPASRMLTYRDEPVTLRPKEMELLALLASAFPQTVSKDDIVGALWREGATDMALSQVAYRLRRELATFDPSFEYVRTVSGYGFRLAKPVSTTVGIVRDHDPVTFRLHQRAVFQLSSRREQSLLASIELFMKALDHDPQYYPSIIGLARAYINAGTRLLVPPAVAYERVRTLLDRALAIESKSGEPYALGSVLELFFVGVTARATELAEHAAALRPDSEATFAALTWNAIAHANIPAAISYSQEALRIRPSSGNLTALAGHALYLDGQYDRAREFFAQALEFHPGYAPAVFYDACAACAQGQYADALAVLNFMRGSDLAARVVAMRAIAWTGLGETGHADRALAEMDALAIGSDLSRAAVYLARGNDERALQLLESSIRRNEPVRFYALVDPFYRRFDPSVHRTLADRLVRAAK